MGGFIQWHMVVICVWCAFFVTSQFDLIFMFQTNLLATFVDIICIFFYIHTLILCIIALNINYKRSKLGYQKKIHSTLRHSSSLLQKYQAER